MERTQGSPGSLLKPLWVFPRRGLLRRKALNSLSRWISEPGAEPGQPPGTWAAFCRLQQPPLEWS